MTNAHKLAQNIINSDYDFVIKHSNRYVIKTCANKRAKIKISREWETFKPPYMNCKKSDDIIHTINLCRQKYPSDDILLQAYDKDTEMMEIYKIFDSCEDI